MRMEESVTGYKTLERPKTILLPRSKREGGLPTISESRSPLLKRLSEEDLLSPDSNEIVHTWLLEQPELNRRVQFAQQSMSSPPRDTERNAPQTEALVLPPIVPEIRVEDASMRTREAPLASTTEPKFFRTTSHRAVSISSASSSTLTRIRQATFAPSPPPSSYQRAPSDGPARSYVSTSTTVRERPPPLPSLELNAALTESDRRRFEIIRQRVPEEFEQLLPTLLKSGAIQWPKRLSESNAQMTVTERRQRQRLLALLDADKADAERNRRLQRLYGSVLPADDILHKHHLLRENLSSEGQLSLLGAYRDAIESELDKHLPYWKSVPMRAVRTSVVEETQSIQRSSILSISLQAKQRFLRYSRTNSQISQLTTDDASMISTPEKIDPQWKKKSAVKIIEQGMTILDSARKLAESDELINAEDFERKAQTCVRSFKRWFFLWSTLLCEDASAQ